VKLACPSVSGTCDLSIANRTPWRLHHEATLKIIMALRECSILTSLLTLWCPTTGKVSVGLASHRSRLGLKWFIHHTSSSLKTYRKKDNHPPCLRYGALYLHLYSAGTDRQTDRPTQCITRPVEGRVAHRQFVLACFVTCRPTRVIIETFFSVGVDNSFRALTKLRLGRTDPAFVLLALGHTLHQHLGTAQ